MKTKNFKFVKQQDEKDCGIACIQMVLHQYGSHYPIHKLREMSGTDLDGTSAYGLKACLEKLHFDCYAIKADQRVWDDEQLQFPVIAHVVKKSYHLHFVVIYGIEGDQLLIADPAKDCYKMTREEFAKEWTGVLLIPVPNAQFQMINERVEGLKAFIPIIFDNKLALTTIFLTSALITLLGIGTTYFFQTLIDDMLPQGVPQQVNLLAGLIVAAYAIKHLTEYFRDKILVRFGQHISREIILKYFTHTLHLPMQFFSTRKTGEIVSRFIDANKIIDALASATVSLVMDVMMVIGIGVALYIQNFPLFLITLLTIPIYALIIYYFYPKHQQANQEEMEKNSELNSGIIESMHGIETIKSHQGESEMYQRIHDDLDAAFEKGFQRVKWMSRQEKLKNFMNDLFSVIILWMGFYQVTQGELTIGQLITYHALLGFFTVPLNNIIQLQGKIQTAQIASERINEVLSIEAENNQGQTLPIIPSRVIEGKDLTYSYNMKDLTLKAIDLSLSLHHHLAIVGPSGSGKSTLAKMFVKFYQPSEGSLSIDHLPLQQWATNDLRAQITYVPQESFFFAGSLRDNLCFGIKNKEALTDDLLLKACEFAGIWDFVDNHPLKLHMYIEEQASNLSGGQKQRFALARALLRQPKLLILDESTSAIDSHVESEIIERLLTLKDTKVMFITHHLPIAMQCDEILVVDQGQVCQQGPHHKLIAQAGKYQDLWQYYRKYSQDVA